MATRKTATKKVAKKATAKKAVKKATKRTYNRKPKAAVEDVASEVNVPNEVNEVFAEPSADVTQLVVLIEEYKFFDLRPLPKIARALFLLELESQGYVDRHLNKPTDTTALASPYLETIEVIELNHVNKVLFRREFGDLTMADGIIATPTVMNGGLSIHAVATGVAAPQEITVHGERFTRAR